LNDIPKSIGHTKFKNSPLGKIPEKWEIDILKNVLKLTSGKPTTKDIINSNCKKNIPVYGGNGIIAYTNKPLISSDAIVIGRVGEYCGNIYYINNPTWITDNALYSKFVDEKLNTKFLYRYLEWFNLSKLKSKTGQPLLNQQVIGDVNILIPPIIEQNKIAAILSSVDKVTEKTESLINKLKDLKKAMMQELLTKGIGHTKFKNSPLGKIPEEWEVVRLNQKCIKITDGSHFSPAPVEKGFPIATVENMRDAYIDVDSCKRIKIEDYNDLKKNTCAPQIHDVLFSKDGTIGKTFVYKQIDSIVLLSSIAIIRVDLNELNPYYCSLFLESPIFSSEIEKTKTGSALKRIVLKDIKQILIPIPSIDEQDKISKIIIKIKENIKQKQTYLSKIKNLKTALMQDLLTGKVRVKE